MKLIGKIFKIIGILTLVSFVLAIAILIFIPSQPEQKYSNVAAMYPKTNLNIRKGPSSNHEILKTVQTNTKLLTSDSISNGFMMVLNEDSTKFGWASERYLQMQPVVLKTEIPKRPLEYSIHKEDVYEAPIKTQVTLEVLIKDKEMNEQRIKALLNYLYDKTIKRSGFKHHDHPTNIYIYAYTSKDKAESGMGQWVGMISKSYNDKNPKINISDRQLSALTEVARDKWDLTHKQRKEIWNKTILAEDKAQKEADKIYPLDKPGITQDDIIKNIELMRKLNVEYENEITKEYGVDKAIIDSISLEGIRKGWAFPKWDDKE